MTRYPEDECTTCGVDTVGIGHVKCGRCGTLQCIECWPKHKDKCYDDEYRTHPAQISVRG